MRCAAQIIVGAVATHLGSASIGRPALLELCTAVDLFEEVAKMTERAQPSLVCAFLSSSCLFVDIQR